MQDSTRKTVFVVLGFLLLAGIGIWWYFGFSLDFMKFFAATPQTSATPFCTPRPACLDAKPPCDIPEPEGGFCLPSPPPGCYYQVVQCVQAPCPPQLVCPSVRPTFSTMPPTGNGMVQCAPATQTVRTGATATLTATRGNGSYEWFAPQGVLSASSGQSIMVTYTTAGIKKVTVLANRGDGSFTVDSVACTVIVQ